MRQSAAGRFHVTCRYYGRSVVTVPRIGDFELAQLREHLQLIQPREDLPTAPSVADVLKHFDVENAP